MATQDKVSDTRPPDGPPTNFEQHSERACEMNDRNKDALIEKLKMGLSAAQSQLETATTQNERNCKLMTTQEKEISQLEAATKDLDKLREDSERDKRLIDILQLKAAQLKTATQKQCDELRAEVLQLKAAAAGSEQGKLLVEELQQKVKLLEDSAAKSQHDERSIRLSERCELLSTYNHVLQLKKAVIKGRDDLAQREHKCADREMELDNRTKLMDMRDALAAADPQKELQANLEQAFKDGMKHGLAADSSEAKAVQLQYSEQKNKIVLDQEHAEILLNKMQAFAEDPAEWHLKVMDLAAIQAQRPAHEGTEPEQFFSAKELRFAKVTARQVRNERHATTLKMVGSLSALWLIETRAMSRRRVSEYFETDSSKPGHMFSVGYRVGKAIQKSISWRDEGPDRDSVLVPGDWKEEDLLTPGGDVEKLPYELQGFWLGVREWRCEVS